MVQVDTLSVGEAVNPDYKLYHPKWHRRRIPIFWWLKKLAYSKFIIRELTSLAVCYAAILMLVQIWALSQGEAFYERWLVWLSWRPIIALHSLVFLALIFATVCWSKGMKSCARTTCLPARSAT